LTSHEDGSYACFLENAVTTEAGGEAWPVYSMLRQWKHQRLIARLMGYAPIHIRVQSRASSIRAARPHQPLNFAGCFSPPPQVVPRLYLTAWGEFYSEGFYLIKIA